MCQAVQKVLKFQKSKGKKMSVFKVNHDETCYSIQHLENGMVLATANVVIDFDEGTDSCRIMVEMQRMLSPDEDIKAELTNSIKNYFPYANRILAHNSSTGPGIKPDELFKKDVIEL